jgi:hypothetical protein
MKTIYHVELTANMWDGNPGVQDGHWMHCADSLEAAVDFIREILHKREEFPAARCVKLTLTRYIEENQTGFFQWHGASDISVDQVNKLIQNHEDFEALYNHLMEAAQKFNFNVREDEQGIYDDKWNLCYQEFIEFE